VTDPSPLVTVVIPTFDRLPLLKEAVASVRAQTYARWELVVADDGSTDGTAEWVGGSDDPRIRLLPLPHCGQPAVARNRGVATGSGELVAFLDSDDVWLPRKLEAQVAALRESDARWCYARYEIMDEEGRPAPRRAGVFRPLSGSIAREIASDHADVFIGTVLVERTLFDEVGGFSEDAELRHREDWELEVRLAARAPVAAVDETLARVRQHAGRRTAAGRNPFLAAAAACDVLLRHPLPPDVRAAVRRARARHLADAAAARLARGDYGDAARLFARSLAGPPDPATWARALVRGVCARLRRA
jgi:glycosyltransferase involved in cell wall biosynthesis